MEENKPSSLIFLQGTPLRDRYNPIPLAIDKAHQYDPYHRWDDELAHCETLLNSLNRFASNSDLTEDQIKAIRSKKGQYLSFTGVKNKELATKSLENIPSGIRLLTVKVEDKTTQATVFIPEKK
jgi:hypothetical protein